MNLNDMEPWIQRNRGYRGPSISYIPLTEWRVGAPAPMLFKGQLYSSACFGENRYREARVEEKNQLEAYCSNWDERWYCLGSGGSNEVHKKWSDFIHILKVEPIEVVFKQGGLQKEMGGKGWCQYFWLKQ